MGFFSWLFGHKDNVEPVETDDIDEVPESEPEVDDTTIVIEPVDQRKSIDVDFQMEVVVEDEEFVVKATVDGSEGQRVYEKEFDTVEKANDYISSSSTRVINWVNQGKSLYQAMSYLNMSRNS